MEHLSIILTGGVVLGILAGALSCATLWRGYSYFGDGLSHALLLGLVISNGKYQNIYLILIAAAFTFFILMFKDRYEKASIIGVVSNGFLSLSLLFNNFSKGKSIESFLFGDILSLSKEDILGLTILSLTVVLFSSTSPLFLYSYFLYSYILLLIFDSYISIINV